MTPAGKLQAYLRKKVEALGGHYRKAQWENRVGCPDCYVWLDSGAYAWVEIKAGRGKLTDDEQLFHAAYPGRATIARSPEQAVELMQNFDAED